VRRNQLLRPGPCRGSNDRTRGEKLKELAAICIHDGEPTPVRVDGQEGALD
jgi:hypothetical protein